MFTGIIEAQAKVTEQGKGRLIVERPEHFSDVQLGSSIAVSGVCLTVTALDDRSLTFDVMPETVAKTTIGDLSIGAWVNLERALPAHGRFEGHVVQGHVEGTGIIVDAPTPQPLSPRKKGGRGEEGGRGEKGQDVRLEMRVPPELRRSIVPKGSIAVDGVSLTVADVGADTFTVALIPMTLEHTTLGGKRTGDRVNIETDILVRTLIALR